MSRVHADAVPDDDWTSRAVWQIPSRTLDTPDDPLRVLILYGSLRQVSYSKFLAHEFGRLLARLGADVRIFDPTDLPIKDEGNTGHAKVTELRDLCVWSEANVWVSPEQHGTMTGVFKNQIDWIPLSLGSVRPTQGRTLALAQVNGGSQSFNCLNQLRILGRWMRCFTIPNQSSIPKAWTQFDSEGRLKDTGFRERVVDVAEELWKMTYLLRPARDQLDDRYSERKEKLEKGRLQSQAEKEAAKDEAAKSVAAVNGEPGAGTNADKVELYQPDVGGDQLAPSTKV
ncbi:putative Arsenic resistance protein ArsH [Taphrina deformans PYCC 5710]|uniref:Arsenic resistance protein ArsH n=1 Tax=Taphrina deformans (strain PYCC 5710 / ATCC 11124 / CBS 356.35 / IMI 108563 / JCM 9778 / NBRC 8474) TaxID=1097556 RepID=R4X7L2_TAPDE|nr:putative Arsenic resistance protein ArsH [Taphrina deformans PYCC 5710]|eukprot:CCG81118.1 putative Arsenic resistance protein ArsH [Taphrina deformans PYCC 5710]